jgi:hypothetical protein
MKGLMVFLRVAAVGLALLAGGRALYHNRGRLSINRLKASAGSFRNLKTHLGRAR